MALHTAEFTKRLEVLQERMTNGELTDRNYRLLNIHLAIKEHIGKYRERPKADDLAILADMLLDEELRWSHPDKMTLVEYPFMSETQVEVREKKHKPHDDIQFKDRQFNGRRKTSFTDDYGAPQVRNNRMVGVLDGEVERLISYIDLYDALDNAGLTQRQSEAIKLVYFENMTQEEAGMEMGVRKHTVNEHLEIALRKLRNHLTKNTELLTV